MNKWFKISFVGGAWAGNELSEVDCEHIDNFKDHYSHGYLTPEGDVRQTQGPGGGQLMKEIEQKEIVQSPPTPPRPNNEGTESYSTYTPPEGAAPQPAKAGPYFVANQHSVSRFLAFMNLHFP